MLEALFPNGAIQYLAGGLLVGLGVLTVFILRGYPVGASTLFPGILSFISKLPYLQDPRLKEMRASRIQFSIGFVLGAAIIALTLKITWTTQLSPIRLFIGGLIAGFGVRLGRGCTSGHGVVGIGSRSKNSLIATIIFVTVAIITANILYQLGVVA